MEIEIDNQEEMTYVYLTLNSPSRDNSGIYACKGDFIRNANETKVIRVTMEADFYGNYLGIWKTSNIILFIYCKLYHNFIFCAFLDPVKITNTSQNQEIILGKEQVVKCGVTGEPKPTVKWDKDGNKLEMSGG